MKRVASEPSLPRRRSYMFVTQSFLSHERGAGMHDKPLRTFAWAASLNQALVTHCVRNEKYYIMHLSMVCPRNRIFFLSIVTRGILSLNFERKYSHKTSFTCIPKFSFYYEYVLTRFYQLPPCQKFFNIAKDQKIMCTDRKLVLEFCIRLLVYSKCQIK